MKKIAKKLLMTLFASSCFLTSIPSLSSCSNKSQYIYRYYEDAAIEQNWESVNAQLAIFQEYIKGEYPDYDEPFKQIQGALTDIFKLLIQWSEHTLVRADPIDIIQQCMCKNSFRADQIYNRLLQLINWYETNGYIDDESATYYSHIARRISNGSTSLLNFIKFNFTLRNIIDQYLVPISTKTQEEVWAELLDWIWEKKDWTGLNCDHQTGLQLVDTPVDKVSLPDSAKFESYNYDLIKPGDIYYSDVGFQIAGQNTGHIAIVEGTFTDPNNKKYVRVIESNNYGCSYGYIDDNRMDIEHGYIYRLNGLSVNQANKAISFAKNEVSKNHGYSFPIFISMQQTSQFSWYCSEFIWASYMAAGIDINADAYSPEWCGISPNEINFYRDKTQILNYKDTKN